MSLLAGKCLRESAPGQHRFYLVQAFGMFLKELDQYASSLLVADYRVWKAEVSLRLRHAVFILPFQKTFVHTNSTHEPFHETGAARKVHNGIGKVIWLRAVYETHHDIAPFQQVSAVRVGVGREVNYKK